ncbi:hypothetical protein DEO72_LG7g1021 [Vigna unguiculata]|uniref:Uncharacterized protein n=1 Tax=Vigna unguiculata TaxID=3917 RepID=A0A4D6MIA6_VIGUN|nr:hypothetical protein DEO72_LG7g1021 [Vigna unguiculata]
MPHGHYHVNRILRLPVSTSRCLAAIVMATTDRPIIEEGNLSEPIRTGHNQHTLTSNTRQPELNSRVPHVHPPSRAQLEGCHSELNSRNATCLTPIPSSTQGIRSEPQLKEHQQIEL